MAIDYFDTSQSRKSVEDVYIFCDCSSAIASIDKMEFKKKTLLATQTSSTNT